MEEVNLVATNATVVVVIDDITYAVMGNVRYLEATLVYSNKIFTHLAFSSYKLSFDSVI